MDSVFMRLASKAEYIHDVAAEIARSGEAGIVEEGLAMSLLLELEAIADRLDELHSGD